MWGDVVRDCVAWTLWTFLVWRTGSGCVYIWRRWNER